MFFKNLGIQKKLVVFSLIVTIIPLLVLEIVFLTLFQKKNVEVILESAEVNADQLRDNYQNELDKLEYLAKTLENFSPLKTYLSSEYENDGKAFDYYLANIHPMLSGCNSLYEGTRVRIYHSQKQLRNFSFELNNELAGLAEEVFPDDSYMNKTDFWIKTGRNRYNSFDTIFSYYRIVRSNMAPYERMYVVSVNVSEELFYAQIANEPADSRAVFITDKAGNILTSNQPDSMAEALTDLPLEEGISLMELPERGHVVMNGTDYYLLRRETDELNIIYMVEYGSVYAAQREIVVTLVLIGCMLMALSAFLMVCETGSITRRIEILKQKMVNIDREEIRTLASYDLSVNSKDEIMQLDIMFTSMMGEIDILMDRIQRQERKLKDEIITRQQAEIRALQHQINPHYLFNTLEAIRMNLIINGDRENAEIVKLFADSFRRYVDIREKEVPLLEEIEFVQKYIRIQNYRLNNKFGLVCEVDEELYSYRIMKLLLQPLVENAVCHGIEQKVGKGKILLRIHKVEHGLEIIVEDDGVGMTEDELKKLRSIAYSEKAERSVGLQNVYQRVKLIYGSKAEMTIDSIKDAGTRIRLVLPLTELEEHI